MSDAPTTGVGTPSPQPAATEPELTPDQQAAQVRAAAIMEDPKGPYWDAEHPDHERTVAQVRGLHKLLYPEPEPAEPPSRDDLRRSAAVQLPALPQGYEFDEVHESNFLQYALDEGIPAGKLSRLYEWYAEKYITSGGALDKQAEADFRRDFAGVLRPEQIELMIRWHREEVQG